MRDWLLDSLMAIRGDDEPGPMKRRFGGWILRNLPGMLTCAEFESFVLDYYEGKLDSGVRRRFDRHMALCPMCGVHFESYVRAIELGQRVCEDDDQLPFGMPEELVGAILSAARAGDG